MNEKECIFCEIINQNIPSEVVYETATILIIKDIAPKAPIHYLIIPKKHIRSVQELKDYDKELAGQLLLMARDLSQQIVGDSSFRLVINTGQKAGQIVPHLHIHFLAGAAQKDF